MSEEEFNNSFVTEKTWEELGSPKISELAARILNIMKGEEPIVSIQMLANIGIRPEDSKPRIFELIKAGLVKKVEGGFKAL